MTQQHNPAPIQEPGIGGPVDLAGIARYRKIRLLAMLLLWVVMTGVILSSGEGWLVWPVEFPFHQWLPGSAMALFAGLWGYHALHIPTGNKTETWLALLTALLAIGLGITGTVGGAALLSLWRPSPPNSVIFLLPVLGGYATALSLTFPATILANHRYKRLAARAERALSKPSEE